MSDGNGDQVSFNLAMVFTTVARSIPDQNFLVWRDRRFSYAEFDARVDRELRAGLPPG